MIRLASTFEPICSIDSGDGRHPGCRRHLAGAHLVAHELECLGRRPDEGRPHPGDGPREGGLLRQEPVARVDGVGAAAHHGVGDRGQRQVRVEGGVARQHHDLVRHPHVEGVAIGLAAQGDGRDPEVVAGADHPDGDLPPVGDQHPAEHITKLAFVRLTRPHVWPRPGSARAGERVRR
jgi:hypothetical protein